MCEMYTNVVVVVAVDDAAVVFVLVQFNMNLELSGSQWNVRKFIIKTKYFSFQQCLITILSKKPQRKPYIVTYRAQTGSWTDG